MPYIWNWYAWSHLIAPHTAGMNIVDRHIKIMESFITYPQLHFEAIHTQGMMGGPFINLNESHQPYIESLLSQTKNDCKKLIKLSEDIKQFDIFLQNHARGCSLEEYYINIPSSLKGMIEIVYDLNNHPKIRFIEALLYKNYYDVSAQSICLTQANDDYRPFCLSTPCVHNETTLQVFIPFSSPLIDTLVHMKTRPYSADSLCEELSLPAAQQMLFHSFFTKETLSIKMDRHYKGNGVRVRYFGHACVLLQTAAISILLDPALGYNYDGKRNDRYSYDDLPDVIDYLIITHNHQDHFLFEAILQFRHKIQNVVVPSTQIGALEDPSLKLILKAIGFKNIICIDEFDTIAFSEEGLLTALPFLGEHGDLNVQSKRAYHITLHGHAFLFLADSNNLDHHLYEHIFAHIGKVDTLFIGMECMGAPLSWLYGPLFSATLAREFDNSRRLSGSNFEKAWKIVKASGCKEVNIYAMGMEPWLSYVMAIDYQSDSLPIIESNKLIDTCLNNNILANKLFGKKEWLFNRD